MFDTVIVEDIINSGIPNYSKQAFNEMTQFLSQSNRGWSASNIILSTIQPSLEHNVILLSNEIVVILE